MKTCAIILPTYKSEKYIKQCILSIQRQVIPDDWKVDIRIGVDGCEETAKYINIPYFYSAENVGSYVMRNSLIKQSYADAYMLFDSDDVMLTNYISETLNTIDKGHSFIMTAKINTDEYLKPVRESRIEDGGAFTFTHEVLEKLGGFHPYRVAGDTDFMRRVLMAGFEIYNIKKPLYLRRKHSGQMTKHEDMGMRTQYRQDVWDIMTAKRDQGKIFVEPEITPLEYGVQEFSEQPVFLLIRTSNRPIFFFNMMESVRKQTYKNIITIVHSDNPDDLYVYGDVVLHGEKIQSDGNAPYNLYCNSLLQAVPDVDGYYMFLDDDDIFFDNTVIERFVKASKPCCINICKVMRWNFELFPKRWQDPKFGAQTECFMLHTRHKNLAEWWPNKAGDYNYSRKIQEILPSNFIENLISCKPQEGKGNGTAQDLGGILIPSRPGNICFQPIQVQYLRDIKTPTCLRGNKDDIKTMPRHRAERLQFKGKVRILSEVLNGEAGAFASCTARGWLEDV